MELLYRNNYGASYLMEEAPNPNHDIQLVINSIGLYMSKKDLENLLNIVLESNAPCNCEECGGKTCNRVWCNNPLVDICLKVDEPILELLEDLIRGTQFILNMDDTLKKFRLDTN